MITVYQVGHVMTCGTESVQLLERRGKYMIRQLVQIQKRIVPDLIEEMQTRYDILHYVRLMQPIGRRTLATSLGLTERVLRREVDFLKQQDLLEVATQGMSLTDEGRTFFAACTASWENSQGSQTWRKP